MNETMQTIVVAVIIVAAVAWSVRRMLKSNKGGCGCGCNCGSDGKCDGQGCEGAISATSRKRKRCRIKDTGRNRKCL